MGCQLNENDSEKIKGMLESMQYSKAEDAKDADIVVFNTCCVRENAEDKLFGNFGRSKKIQRRKRNNCSYRWLHDARKHIVEKLKELSFLLI